MKLTFFGAAHAVTGSCHCLEACGKKILVDCGLQQGRDEVDDNALPFHAGEMDFTAIAIVGGKGKVDSFVSPCGVCRQVMAEFAEDDFFVLLCDGEKTEKIMLSELLPHSFSGKNLT